MMISAINILNSQSSKTNLIKNNNRGTIPFKNLALKLEPPKDTFIQIHKQGPKPITSLGENFHKPVKLFFSDIDGTIMRSDTKNVPESAHKAMEDLKDAGIPLIYATGRCIAELQLIQDKLPTKPDYYILEQGTQITDENYNIIYQDTMTVEDAKTVIDLHKKLREEDPSLQILVYFDGIPYTTSTLEDVPENKRSLVKTVDSFDKLLESRARPTKIMFYKKDSKGYGDMEGLQESIAKNLKKMPLSAVITSTRYCEVFNATSSKGKAIRVIADLSGVDLENTAAIGDSGNDLDMIGAVQKGGGVGIAMGNGMDDLKESSDYTTLDIKNNGFALAVNQIIENNRRLC